MRRNKSFFINRMLKNVFLRIPSTDGELGLWIYVSHKNVYLLSLKLFHDITNQSYRYLHKYVWSICSSSSSNKAGLQQQQQLGRRSTVSSSASLGSPSTGKCTHGANNVSIASKPLSMLNMKTLKSKQLLAVDMQKESGDVWKAWQPWCTGAIFNRYIFNQRDWILVFSVWCNRCSLYPLRLDDIHSKMSIVEKILFLEHCSFSRQKEECSWKNGQGDLNDVERLYWKCKWWIIAERIPSSRALTARDEATAATGPTILFHTDCPYNCSSFLHWTFQAFHFRIN